MGRESHILNALRFTFYVLRFTHYAVEERLRRTALGMAMVVLLCAMPAACDPVIGSSANSDHITVQHILVAVSGASRVTPFNVTTPVSRTPEQAKARAEQLLKSARQGQDFDKLVRENSDDAPPGIYTMSNIGVPAQSGEYPRANVPAGFAAAGAGVAVSAGCSVSFLL